MNRSVLRAMLVMLMALVAVPAVLPTAHATTTNRAGLVIVYGPTSVYSTCISFGEAELPGAELLHRSGLRIVSMVQAVNGEAICKIEDTGCDYPGEECFCRCLGTPCNYWSYWYWQGNAWIYSGRGAGNRVVRNGDIDAWVWGDGNTPPPAPSSSALCSSPTQTPTWTSVPPTATRTATFTPQPTATDTPIPSTPTDTPIPPTPTDTAIPPTATFTPWPATSVTPYDPYGMMTSTPWPTWTPYPSQTSQATMTPRATYTPLGTLTVRATPTAPAGSSTLEPYPILGSAEAISRTTPTLLPAAGPTPAPVYAPDTTLMPRKAALQASPLPQVQATLATTPTSDRVALFLATSVARTDITPAAAPRKERVARRDYGVFAALGGALLLLIAYATLLKRQREAGLR